MRGRLPPTDFLRSLPSVHASLPHTRPSAQRLHQPYPTLPGGPGDKGPLSQKRCSLRPRAASQRAPYGGLRQPSSEQRGISNSTRRLLPQNDSSLTSRSEQLCRSPQSQEEACSDQTGKRQRAAGGGRGQSAWAAVRLLCLPECPQAPLSVSVLICKRGFCLSSWVAVMTKWDNSCRELRVPLTQRVLNKHQLELLSAKVKAASLREPLPEQDRERGQRPSAPAKTFVISQEHWFSSMPPHK